MTALYLMDVRDVARNIRRAEDTVSAAYPERMEEISRLTREEDRLRSLAAGLLLCEALGAPPILREKGGKPYSPEGPCFNLSHSGGFAALVVGHAPVGVDIEKRVEDDYTLLARAAFHSDERRALEQAPTARFFFDVWTLKESYLKMLGAGLLTDPSSFSVKITGRSAQITRGHAVSKAYLRLYDLESYSAAVCSALPDCPGEIRMLRFTPQLSEI